MLLNDIEHLPKSVTDVNGINDVLEAIEPEIIQLRTDVQNFNKEFYIKTTEELIARWEKDFGLKYNSRLTLKQRRQRVLNKLARKKILNWDNFKLLIRNNLDEGTNFSIANRPSQYAFTIYVDTQDYSALESAISAAKPAYLTFNVVYYEFAHRYCGTFNCGTEPI